MSHFLCRLRVQLRYGELSRASLRLLRIEVVEGNVECDWLARPPDPFDAGVSQKVRERHFSLQTLRDAIDVRSLMFSVFPNVESARLRIFREIDDKRELIVTGLVQRNDNSSRWVHSLVMRAKVLGFRFRLEDEVLYALPGGGKTLTTAGAGAC